MPAHRPPASGFLRDAPPPIPAAYALAAHWCAGHFIDGSPALVHAVKVAALLSRTCPASPELIAAALLHDGPTYIRPDPMAAAVIARCGTDVLRLVRAIHSEHEAMEAYRTDPGAAASRLAELDDQVLCVLAADKTVSVATIVRRGARAADPAVYWASRGPFLATLPYLSAFADAAAPRIAPSLAVLLTAAIERATVHLDRVEPRPA
jgi:HD domain